MVLLSKIKNIVTKQLISSTATIEKEKLYYKLLSV